MAATAEDARAMVRAARAHPDRIAMVVPGDVLGLGGRARSSACSADGAIGRVRHVQVAWDASGPGDPGDFWRWQRATSGENVMALGILAEAMTRWLGQPEAVTARHPARPGRSDPGPAGPIAADVPDHVLALVEYPDDVTATVEMSARTNGIDVRPRDVPRHDRQPRRRPRRPADRARPRRRPARRSTSATRTAPAGPPRSTSSAPSAAARRAP